MFETSNLLGELEAQNGSRKRGCTIKLVEEILMGIFFVATLVGIVIVLIVFGPGSPQPITVYQFDDLFDSSFSPRGVSAQWVQEGLLAMTQRDGNTTNVVSYNVTTDTSTTLFSTSLFANISVVLSSMSFSSDNKYVLIAASTQKIWRNSFYANYIILDLNAKTYTWLGGYSNSSNPQILNAQWNPSANQIAYVMNNNIYVESVPSNGSHIEVSTDGAVNEVLNGIFDWVYEEEVFGESSALWWSPDGQSLAYLSTNDTNVPTFSFPYYENILESSYTDIIPMKYPKAGATNPTVEVRVYTLSGAKTVSLTLSPGEEYITDVMWASSSLLMYKTSNRLQNNETSYFYNVTTGTAVHYVSEVATKGWIEPRPQSTIFLQDQYLCIRNHSGYYHIALVNTLSGQVDAWLTNGTFDVLQMLRYRTSDGALFFLSSEVSPTERHLFRIYILTNTTRVDLTPKEGYYNANFDPTGKYYILNYQGPNIPTVSLYREEAQATGANTVVKVLEDNSVLANKLSGYSLPTKTYMSIPINRPNESYNLNAWIVMPPTALKISSAGLLFSVYCGPNSQTVMKAWTLGFSEYIASNLGIAVISVDTRGTGARGIEFAQQTYLSLGEDEADDLVQVNHYITNTAPYSSLVSNSHTAVYGSSYGGYMALKSLIASGSNFQTAVSVAPVTDWRLYDTFYTERFMQTPDLNKVGYDNTSVVLNVDKLKAANKNFLLIHGTADDNVHFQNTAELNLQLVSNGVQYETMFYANRDHSINGGGARPHMYKLISNFLESNLRP